MLLQLLQTNVEIPRWGGETSDARTSAVGLGVDDGQAMTARNLDGSTERTTASRASVDLFGRYT